MERRMMIVTAKEGREKHSDEKDDDAAAESSPTARESSKEISVRPTRLLCQRCKWNNIGRVLVVHGPLRQKRGRIVFGRRFGRREENSPRGWAGVPRHRAIESLRGGAGQGGQ